MVQVLGSPGVDANGTDELVQNLIFNHLCILTLDEVLSIRVLHDKDERLILVLHVPMSHIVDDFKFVQDAVCGLDQELFTIFKDVHLVDINFTNRIAPISVE